MNIKDKKILITGGAGFIGTTIGKLLADNNEVVLFDNLARNTLKHTNLAEHKNITLIEGDVLNYDLVASSVAGCDIVVHAAAIAGIDTVVKEPITTMEVNFIGTSNVLRAAQKHNVGDRVILFSTSEVFGNFAYKVSETMDTVTGSAGEARWVYAVSKMAGEHLAQAYYTRHNLPTVIVRPFNVYGPGQTGEGAIQKFIGQALKNEDINIYGDGTQIRAWCYVSDFVRCLEMSIENPGVIGESFNIGNSKAITTIYGLAQAVCRVLNSKSKIKFTDSLSADIELRIPETKKATDLLGFVAEVDLEDGIKQTAEWYLENAI